MYRAALDERARIEAEGGCVVRVRLDAELKAIVATATEKARAEGGDRAADAARFEVAQALELPVEEGRVMYPDAQLDIEDRDAVSGPPHLIVRVGADQDTTPAGAAVPAFVARSRVAEYQLMAEQSREAVQLAQQEAEAQIAAMRQDATAQVNEFRSTYPTRLQFPYELDDKAARWPFLVQGMWHDGQFTYVRSTAQETPALYENKDGEPSLIPYDLEQDGLFIVRRLVGRGWLQIGRERAGWKVDLDDLD